MSTNLTTNYRIKVVAFALLYLCLIVITASISYSRAISQYYIHLSKSSVSPNNIFRAIEIDATNPSAYQAKGNFYQQMGDFSEATKSFKEAINLQPNYYFLWLQLAYSNAKLNDFKSSKIAYKRAINLAPQYYQAQYYLGLLYLNEKDYDSAFNQLSSAAESNPDLFPDILKLAYRVFSGDPIKIKNYVRTNSLIKKKQMEYFFIKNNIISNDTISFLIGNELNDNEKAEFVTTLLNFRHEKLAFVVWSSKSNNQLLLTDLKNNLVVNGNFENSIENERNGFGWIIPNEQNIITTLEHDVTYSGVNYLKFEFNGTSIPTNPILSQIIIVKPNHKYKLTFNVRIQEIISAGLPMIMISDGNSDILFNKSLTLNPQNNQWQSYTIDFKTPAKTEILSLKLLRQNCTENPCPIYGSLMLDNFVLKEL